MWQIYWRKPMPKCDFNKVAKQLYLNHISTWVLSSKFTACFHRAYSSCFMHAIVARMRLPFFKIFSYFVTFCSNCQIIDPFLPFFWKISRMPLVSRIGPISEQLFLRTTMKSGFFWQICSWDFNFFRRKKLLPRVSHLKTLCICRLSILAYPYFIAMFHTKWVPKNTWWILTKCLSKEICTCESFRTSVDFHMLFHTI